MRGVQRNLRWPDLCFERGLEVVHESWSKVMRRFGPVHTPVGESAVSSAVLMKPPLADSARSGAIDSLRGLLLVVMALNHIPSDLRPLTDQPLGYSSAAEGFIFLSGLLAGGVYCRRAHEHGLLDALRAALMRALIIYRAHAICVLLVFAWAVSFNWIAGRPAHGAPALFVEQPVESLFAALVMLYQPGLLDILPLYCGLFLAMPFIVVALLAKQVRLLLFLSLAFWLVNGMYAGQSAYVDGIINSGAINFWGWQLLFVAGAVCGQAWPRNHRARSPSTFAVGAVVALVAALAAARHGLLPLPAAWSETLTNKINLGPLRCLSLLGFAYLIALALRRWPGRFEIPPLRYLGRRSLPVFGAHVVAAIATLGLPEVFAMGFFGRALGAAFVLGAMYVTAAIACFAAMQRRASEKHGRRLGCSRNASCSQPVPCKFSKPLFASAAPGRNLSS